MLAIVGVGLFRLARVTVDADADQIAGDGLTAGVPQQPTHREPVEAPVVVKAGSIVLDNDRRAGRIRLLGTARGGYDRRRRHRSPGRLVLQPALPDGLARVQSLLRTTGEVLGRLVPTQLDVAYVGRVEAHPSGQLPLGQSPYLTPVGDLSRERLGGLLNRQGIVPRIHQSPRPGHRMR